MKILSIACLVLLVHLGYEPKNLFTQVLECTALNKENLNTEYHLMMVSHPACGPCRIAIKDLRPLVHTKKLDFLILEYGDDRIRTELKEKYPKITFIKPTDCLDENLTDFFPQFELIDAKGKVLWKRKGWRSKYLSKIEKIINS